MSHSFGGMWGLTFVAVFLFALMVMGVFLAWREEVAKREALEQEIADLKATNPNYSIQLGQITQFSVAEIIRVVSGQVEAYAEKPMSEIIAEGTFRGLATVLPILNKARDDVHRLKTGETREQKLDRLKAHLKELKGYEKSLSNTYLIPMSFIATRFDGNVHIELDIGESASIVLENDYVKNGIPKTSAPNPFGSLIVPASFPGYHVFQSPNIRSSVGEDAKSAYSEIKDVNASQKYPVFDRDFYLTTSQKSVQLKFTIYSKAKIEPQIINLECSLDNPKVLQLDDSSKLE